MYNRYIRNDDGVYQRIPHPDGPTPRQESRKEGSSRQESWEGVPPHHESREGPPPRQDTWAWPPPPRQEPWEQADEGKGFLDKILKKLNLGDIDKGDILLLLILLFLFDQGEDEELLIALGLLFLL